jgi:thioredoxin reductase
VLTDEALIVGAGPFGVSISAHLRALGIQHRIVGRPMDTWRAHMPKGMYLKSEPYASDMSAPQPGHDMSGYCRANGIEFVERIGPVSLERFLAYADWFTAQLVPDVIDDTVTTVTAVDGGFRVEFAATEPAVVRQLVLATGVLPHTHVPPELASLPPELVSHSSEHHLLDGFAGRRVAVVGAGQSALETAALLQENGAEAQIIVRGADVAWLTANPERLTALGHLRRPTTKLCEGWHCAFWNNPTAFRRLPRDVRATKIKTVLGPAGAWWLKDRVIGKVDVLTSSRVTAAEPNGNGVRLTVDGRRGGTIDVDHVIAGTGFRIGVDRLTFLAEDLRARIAHDNGFPVLTRAGQSTVPGLYFAGAPTGMSLGPSARFLAGTHSSVPALAKSMMHRAKGVAKTTVDVSSAKTEAVA